MDEYTAYQCLNPKCKASFGCQGKKVKRCVICKKKIIVKK